MLNRTATNVHYGMPFFYIPVGVVAPVVVVAVVVVFVVVVAAAAEKLDTCWLELDVDSVDVVEL